MEIRFDLKSNLSTNISFEHMHISFYIFQPHSIQESHLQERNRIGRIEYGFEFDSFDVSPVFFVVRYFLEVLVVGHWAWEIFVSESGFRKERKAVSTVYSTNYHISSYHELTDKIFVSLRAYCTSTGVSF